MQQYWLAFTYVNGLGPVRLRHLRGQFPSIADAWQAAGDDLLACGIPQGAVAHHQQLRRRLDPQQLLAEVEALDAWVLTPDDPSYPPLLAKLPDAPVVLYGRGELNSQDARAVAVVGTRKASGYGKEMASQLVRDLVKHQVTIISGLARGIDGHAQQAALQSGGRTIAVLGSGIDVIYPSDNRALAERITQNGAVLTEFPPGTPPERGNFPIRNRIISGLSLGVVVVEAPERSGAIQTANLASEQGREVFAVPGNANVANSRGTNRMIQDGARLVLDVEDILQELNLQQVAAETRHVAKKIMPSNPTETQIIDILSTEPLHVDELSRLSGLPIQTINTALTIMTMKGQVYEISPMTYAIR